MGVDLKKLTRPENIELEDLSGKAVALDAYNMMYQFLASIRLKDGEPLKDDGGNVVSHLMGLLSRTSNLLVRGIKPVFVFDGVPPELKKSTLIYRKMRKKEAMEEWKRALEEGDLERARSKAQQTSRFTHEMVRETKHVLELMGLPHVQAPADGEAQASYMTEKSEIYGTASQDFDCLLYGSPRMIRNITISGRRKLPGRRHYVTINVEKIELDEMLDRLEVTREQLVDMAILMGTDFNQGIKGIGPKRSLKLLKEHGDLEKVIEEKGYNIEHYREIRKIFLSPETTDDYRLEWSEPKLDELRELYMDGHQFKEKTIRKFLDKIGSSDFLYEQTSLTSF